MKTPSNSIDRATESPPKSMVGAAKSFLIRLFKEDWVAAPISFFFAAVPSNFLTAWIVVAIAPTFARVVGQDTPTFFACTSLATLIIGYTTYVVPYYTAMAYQERRRFRTSDNRFDTRKFFKTVWIDNALHFATDLYCAAAIGVSQVALVASGTTSLFWSIVGTLLAADLWDALYEPLYWSASKTLARDGQLSSLLAKLRTEPANSDTVSASEPLSDSRARQEAAATTTPVNVANS